MKHIGKTTFIEAEGKQYKLSRFTRRLLFQFIEWAGKVLPHPLDVVRDKLAGLPEHIQELLVKDAIQSARLRNSINNPDVQALMTTPEGMMKIIHLLFQQNHPELRESDVERIMDACALEHGDDYLAQKIAEATGQYEPDEEATPSFRKTQDA